ncbi:MAG: mechanosensitive ion channel family protein [Lachnospiraceae bacterium]
MSEILQNFFTDTGAIYVILRMILVFAVTNVVVILYKRAFSKSVLLQSKIHLRFLRNLGVFVIYLMGLLAILYQLPTLDKIIKTVLAGSGILAVIIGLAAQKSLGNAIDGLFISLFHPFEIGDRITLFSKNITGYVEDLSLRQTVLRTYTNNRIIVPNSVISQEMIENSNFIDRRIASFVDVTVAYGADIDKAMGIMSSIIESHPLYLANVDNLEKEEKETEIKVYIRDFATEGIRLRSTMWCKNIDMNFEASSDARYQIYKEFTEQGIKIVG